MSISLLITGYSFGQKFAYVNTELILESMPEYTEAQEELDKLSKKWQETIEQKYSEIDRLYKEYKAEKILLTEELRQKREKEITIKEKELQKFQKDKFGVSGDILANCRSMGITHVLATFVSFGDVWDVCHMACFDKAATHTQQPNGVYISNSWFCKYWFT